jgi:hypothetical protein
MDLLKEGPSEVRRKIRVFTLGSVGTVLLCNVLESIFRNVVVGALLLYMHIFYNKKIAVLHC